MNKYKNKQLIIRINYNTFLRLKRVFPSLKNESFASYFQRLVKYMDELTTKQEDLILSREDELDDEILIELEGGKTR